jgi:hypothetical protein
MRPGSGGHEVRRTVQQPVQLELQLELVSWQKVEPTGAGELAQASVEMDAHHCQYGCPLELFFTIVS